MKKFFLVLGLFLFISTNVHSEYILESANCTLKRSNCGAYLYNNKTGATYFCNIDVGYPSGNNAQYINHMHGHNETFNATLDRVSLYMPSGNFDEGYATILSLS